MPPSQKCQEQLYKMMSKKIGHLNVAILKCLYIYKYVSSFVCATW